MGQKCNPTGLRIGVIKNWDSRWYAKKGEFGDTLVEDYKLRKYLLETLSGAGVPKVEIERDAKRVRINIHCAKPGMVIGKQGAEIEKLRALCAKKLGKELNEVYINIVEIKQPDLNATLVAQNVAGQLERRVSFRRAVKGAIRNTMRLGARGIDYGFAEAHTTYGRIGVKVWIYQGEVLHESRNKRRNRREGGNR